MAAYFQVIRASTNFFCKKIFAELLFSTLFPFSFLYAFSFSEDFSEHLLPQEHPLYKKMEVLFKDPFILEDMQQFKQMGFSVLQKPKPNKVTVASHPELPGYLVKCYIGKQPLNIERLLLQRCIGEKKIREVIESFHMRHFVVPTSGFLSILLPPKRLISFLSRKICRLRGI